MATDVFAHTDLAWGGAFVADMGLVQDAHGLVGVLMQGLSLQYSQNISKIYEVGRQNQKPKFYLVGGRSTGSLGAQHVVGPGVAMGQYYRTFSDVCAADQNGITLNLNSTQGGCAGGAVTYTAKYCVLASIGINTNSNDLIINHSSNLTFSNLAYTEFNAAGLLGTALGGAIGGAGGALGGGLGGLGGLTI